MTPPVATLDRTVELPKATMGDEREGWLEQARVIQLFETFGWAYDVRWPRQKRVDARRAK